MFELDAPFWNKMLCLHIYIHHMGILWWSLRRLLQCVHTQSHCLRPQPMWTWHSRVYSRPFIYEFNKSLRIAEQEADFPHNILRHRRTSLIDRNSNPSTLRTFECACMLLVWFGPLHLICSCGAKKRRLRCMCQMPIISFGGFKFRLQWSLNDVVRLCASIAVCHPQSWW